MRVRHKYYEKLVWFFLFFFSVLLRVAYLTKYPAGVNADEAYAGYEAYALLNTGIDSHGYAYPVYFISWGNGMNVLYSYLSIPFQKILGSNLLAVRLPQALLGCVTLAAFYWLLKEIKGKKTAFFGMFLLGITPWHIMMCRWGLESNLVPAFLLFGICFLVQAWKGKTSAYLISFFMFGLVLYAYAIMWIFVPILLCLGFFYGLYYKKIKFDKYLIIGILILAVSAVPLILFLLVNNGYLPEMKIGIFSIPRMDSLRNSEISFDDIFTKIKEFLRILITQQDNQIHNQANTGIYYYCSIPFLITGIGKAVYSFFENWRKKEYHAADIMLLWFLSACLTASLIHSVNVNKINCIHLAVIYFIADGIILWTEKVSKKLLWVITGIYLVFFGSFCAWYFDADKHYFYYGYETALEYAQNMTEKEIGTVMIRFPIVLLYTKTLPMEYLSQMENTKNFGTANQFGRYVIEPSADDMQEDVVYVVPKALEEVYAKEGFAVQYDNGYYTVIAFEKQ